MNLKENGEPNEITRRGFCNRVLLTSAGLLAGANRTRADCHDYDSENVTKLAQRNNFHGPAHANLPGSSRGGAQGHEGPALA